MFKEGYNSNTLNSFRSAINFFSSKEVSLGDNPYISQLFRSFYKLKPIKCKYQSFWCVDQVLEFLSAWHPQSQLTLKQLTLKTVALLALSSSDRGQTLHALNIEKTEIVDNMVVFVVDTKLKTTNRVLKPKFVKCVSTNVPCLNVCDYILAYLNKTLALRAAAVAAGKPKPTQLFLSWVTKKPVSKPTIARWLKQVLQLAGIQNYGSHSYRGAGLSKAFDRGISIKDIIQAGDWSNSRTFRRFYYKPTTSAVGEAILAREVRIVAWVLQ